MSEIKNIFLEYRKTIMSNKKYMIELIKGNLPLIKEYDSISKYINFYNEAYEKWDWGIIFHKKFFNNNEYKTYYLLLSVTKPFVDIRQIVIMEMEKYSRNYKYFKSRIKILQNKLQKSAEDDSKKNKKNVENQRMHDLSTGIFSHEEASNRAFFNSFIKPYKSEKTIKIITELDDLYDRFFSYYYIKFEFICSMGIKAYPVSKKHIHWKDKIKQLNKFPIGNKINEEDIKIIMDTANHYKHQTRLLAGFPKMTFMNKLLNKISKKILENTNFKIYSDNIQELYYEIEGILNPLGLTGFG